MAAISASFVSFGRTAQPSSDDLSLTIWDEACAEALAEITVSDGLEIYFCLEGAGSLVVDGKAASLAAHDAALVAQGTPHRLIASGAAFRFQRVSASFERGDLFFQASFPRITGLAAHEPRFALVHGYGTPDVQRFVVRVKKELARYGCQHFMTARGMMLDVLAGLERELEPREPGMPSVEDVLAYLERSFANATLQDAAERFFCHPNSIAKLLKRELGQTFSEVLSEIRMDRARALLDNGGLSVQCVASACGYKNMTHFYRTFSSRFGVTPGEYRKRCVRSA